LHSKRSNAHANPKAGMPQQSRKSGRYRSASGQPGSAHAVRGFSLFINPNATRTARAAFRFDTGHSL
jgi:hypothetical protein